MNVKFDFKGTTVVITGAGQGIGFQLAKDFLSDGAEVRVWDYSPAALEHARQELRAFADQVSFHQVDISSSAACEAAAAETKGPVHVLINNAGITRDRSFAKLSIEDIDQVIQTNLTGAFYVTKSLLPAFATDSGRCRIINISSIVGRDGNFGQTNYAAAKAGLIGMTASLAKELGRKGFTVNCVGPGFIDTHMAQQVPVAVREKIAAQTPVGRFGSTSEISSVCRFLAAKEAAYINGTFIAVDGGLSL